jgi:hypothetical protein
MPLPPPPDGVESARAEQFAPGPRAGAWFRTLLLAALAALLGELALRHWGGATVGVAACGLTIGGWLAAVVAKQLCVRHDEAVVVELREAVGEETERGLLALWTFAPPVPRRLARRELTEAWALAAVPGDQVLARVRHNGFGAVELVLGTPLADGWRLPPPRPLVPLTARLCSLFALLAMVAGVVACAAPSRRLEGKVTAVRQQPWQTGLGQEPWDLTVALGKEHGGERRFEVSHERFLALLPERGQRALASPGLLTVAAREQAVLQYQPVGRKVRVRQTHLGPFETTFYEGPVP